MIITPGIYNNLSNELYHADPAISRTGIMHFLKSPFNYWANYLNPNKPTPKSKPSWKIGTAFHMMVLEPELFENTYLMKSKPVLLKDVGREKYETYKNDLKALESTDYQLIEYEDFITLRNMRVSLLNHEKAWPLIEGATYEQSYFWQDKHSGLMVKSRPDVLHSNMIVDLKTCNDASSHAYQREMLNYHYHTQGAMVRDAIYELTGETINTVINVCVETSYPFNVAIKIIDESALEVGHKKYKQALLDMKACFETNTWESYEPEIVSLPSWAT